MTINQFQLMASSVCVCFNSRFKCSHQGTAADKIDIQFFQWRQWTLTSLTRPAVTGLAVRRSRGVLGSCSPTLIVFQSPIPEALSLSTFELLLFKEHRNWGLVRMHIQRVNNTSVGTVSFHEVIEFFTISPQYKNVTLTKFNLAMPVKIKKTNKVWNI